MTQIEYAKKLKATGLVRKTAQKENVTLKFMMQGISEGTIVIPCNNTRSLASPCAIGKGLSTKINANIGTSPYRGSVKEELQKLRMCIKYKADTIMDLSTGPDLKNIRRQIIRKSPIPVGTVPIYEIAANERLKGKTFVNASTDDMLGVIESQAREGVDFFTIHAGVTKKVLQALKKNKRVCGIVSRGGALIAEWMSKNNRENPLFENFDRILDIAKKFDITLSLGDGLRPGSICDATDKPQIEELAVLGTLAKQCRLKGVQVMIEGPGHVPINQIELNMKLQKKICDNAPFYVLGPLVTDIAPGYDHITSAIGAAMAGYYGADFLCYVTPSEHLSIPTVDDVKQGLIAYRIAAHSADIAKGVKGAAGWDRAISVFRRARQWKKHISCSLDPEKALSIHNRFKSEKKDVCTMCGEYCPLKISETV
jgi:phosphomethylpyrimidine synthase